MRDADATLHAGRGPSPTPPSPRSSSGPGSRRRGLSSCWLPRRSRTPVSSPPRRSPATLRPSAPRSAGRSPMTGALDQLGPGGSGRCDTPPGSSTLAGVSGGPGRGRSERSRPCAGLPGLLCGRSCLARTHEPPAGPRGPSGPRLRRRRGGRARHVCAGAEMAWRAGWPPSGCGRVDVRRARRSGRVNARRARARRGVGATSWQTPLGRRHERYGRDGRPFSLILVEIDDFPTLLEAHDAEDLAVAVQALERALSRGPRPRRGAGAGGGRSLLADARRRRRSSRSRGRLRRSRDRPPPRGDASWCRTGGVDRDRRVSRTTGST